jgi:hypothetical protein
MSKSGYFLIVIGLVLLAYNYSLLDFSLLSEPLALPLIFIAAGLFSIIKSLFKPNDLLEVISSLLGIIIFLAIIINIFSFPLIIFPRTANSIVNLSSLGLSASFASIDFLADLTNASISYESNGINYLESVEHYENYSISNSFSESFYDFGNFNINDLIFENNFGKSTINNLAYADNSFFENNFGELIIYTGSIYGKKELILNNAFGNAKIIIDKDASYKVQSDNSLGSIKNNLGLLSNDYSNATNKISIIIENNFGTVELSKQ